MQKFNSQFNRAYNKRNGEKWQIVGKLQVIKLMGHQCPPGCEMMKKKSIPELVSLPHSLHDFWRKIFLLLYSVNRPIFIVSLPLVCDILDNLCFAFVCSPGSDVKIFEINLIFLINSYFLHDQNVKKKIEKSFLKNFLRTKRVYKIK